MPDRQLIILLYAFFWCLRVVRLRRTWKAPLMRGPGWFLDVRVTPDFAAEQPQVLRRLKLRTLAPYAFEAAAMAALVIWNGPNALVYYLAIIMMMTLAGGAGIVNALKAARAEAEHYRAPGSDTPVSAIALSLEARRLRDYTHWPLEAVNAAIIILALAWILRHYLNLPDWRSFRFEFGRPTLVLYLQAGALLMKMAIVRWRSPAPAAQAAQYLKLYEARRRYLLDACDVARLCFASMMPAWALRLYVGWEWPANPLRWAVLVFYMVIAAVFAIWAMRRMRAVTALAVAITPVKLPAAFGQTQESGAKICWRPEFPVALLNGPRGLAINLANGRTQAALAYTAGMVALFAWF